MNVRIGKLVAIGLALLILAGTAAAQFGPFAGGFGKAALLGNPDVQKELNLTEDQLTKVREVGQQVREKQKEAFGKLKDLPEDQRRDKAMEIFKSITTETDKALAGVLKPEQAKRLRQLELQQRGAQAFADAEIQKEMKLTDEQKEKIKTIGEDAAKEAKDIFQGAQGDFQTAMTKMQTLRKETLEKVVALLTADQKKAWKDLTGAPFEFKFRPPQPKKDQ